MSDGRQGVQTLDQLTLVGLALLLAPVLTMVHELGGHGGACLLTGGRVLEIGAHYIDCQSASLADGRIVAMSGAAIDALFGALAYGAWRLTTAPLLRTGLWMAVVFKLMMAAGYPLFSGIVGVGDLAVGAGRSMGAVSHPLVWRVGLTLFGLVSYLGVILLAQRMLDAMIGGGAASIAARRRMPMTLYLVSGIVTLLVSALNPVGVFVIFTSAAASFGGLAGLFKVAFRPPPTGDVRPFVLARAWPVVIAGLIVAALYIALLGPSVSFA